MVRMAAPSRRQEAPPPRASTAPWTVDDLAALPDDGMRYEIIDGTLVVSPSPTFRHQSVSGALFLLLATACSPDLRVLAAPLDWQPSRLRSFQPDLLVVPAGPLDRPTPTPLVVVEILSPSSRTLDRITKLHAYAQAHVPQYWIVDPGLDGATPSVEVYDLDAANPAADPAYRLQGRAMGTETLAFHGPVPVTVTPSELTR